jgi:hypothetical protein
MKLIYLFLALVMATNFAHAQAQEGTVEYQKSKLPAAVLELPYSPSVVSDALNAYLLKKGKSRSADKKGFTTYRNTSSDGMNADMYFKVERKSRKEKQTTRVSLLLTQPDGGNTNTSNLHYLDMAEAKNYLDGLVTVIQSYNVEVQIKDQDKEVTRAEAKYKSLVNDGEDLENKKNSIEKKIAENKKDQARQAAEVENQKQILAARTAERKG